MRLKWRHLNTFGLIALGLIAVAPFGAAPVPLVPPAEPLKPPALSDQACLACHASSRVLRREAGAGAAASLEVDERTLAASAHSGLDCVDCHRDVTAVPHRLPIARVDCAACHYVEPLPSPAPTATPSELGLHQRIREQHVKRAPRCIDCHGAHDVGSAGDLDSRTNRRRLPSTCGTCHPKIAAEYRESIHGMALMQGNPDVPSCSDCHPEHPRDIGKKGLSGVARAGVVATCIACHEDPGLQRRYALPAERLASYLGSYHGAATELGSSQTANCASCHGAHFILPSTDPRSTINKANLPRTCGRCHPGAGVNFAVGSVHLRPSPRQDRAVFWVKVAYQLFIAGLMLSFLGYICLDLLARLRKRFGPVHRLVPGETEPQFERLTLIQRLQHWALITSFITLIVTGFPLLFPRSEIARGVVTFLGGVGTRAVIHRGAALVLVALVAFHALYVLFSRRGYWEFRQLIPGPKDARDIAQMLGWYFGLTSTRPAFDRYNYIEKFEYLAVGWGSVAMISTGILLWSPSLTLAVLPKWIMDIALVVHSWEAILAFLAIIIWHMYNVHFNPSVFPMSRIWLTGKIGLHELQENHPLEYERIMARQRRSAGSASVTGEAPPVTDGPPEDNAE
jgi:cytochrome b subunit of formate dehydrogenase